MCVFPKRGGRRVLTLRREVLLPADQIREVFPGEVVDVEGLRDLTPDDLPRQPLHDLLQALGEAEAREQRGAGHAACGRGRTQTRPERKGK